MDKQFARILMLSVLLLAGVNLAEAIDRDYVAATDSTQSLASQRVMYPPADSAQTKSIEGRRFMHVIAVEEDAALHRRGGEGPAQPVLVAGRRR